MKLISTLTLLAFTLAPAIAATSPKASKAPAAKPAPLHCPVSGDKIASPKAAYSSEVYKGKTYYFCCPMCKPQFDKNPAKYIQHPATHQG